MAAGGKIRLFLKEKACNVKKSVVYYTSKLESNRKEWRKPLLTLCLE